ncbi:MAG: aspartate dehydrogenase [Candidatus Omnitrophota bacterium]
MKKIKIGVVGCGTIGTEVSLYVDKKLGNSALVVGLTDLEEVKAKTLQERLNSLAKIYDIDTLFKRMDLIIETASVKAAKLVLTKAAAYGKDVVILSVGALIDNAAVVEKAKKAGVKIYVPSGAICGVDGLGALSKGNIEKIVLTTSKPPRGLIGADYLKNKGIDLTNLKKERVIFKGNVAEAVKYFPKNINVAATLALASSFKDVQVCIKADPKLKRNVHCIEVQAREAKIRISVENVPSKANPKTSALTILSTQRLLDRIFSPLKVGS